jgi:hypothetical protein
LRLKLRNLHRGVESQIIRAGELPRGPIKKIIIVVAALLAVNAPASAAGGGKCTGLQARCAIEVGGKCDPNTGAWCYGWWKGQRRGSAAPSKRLTRASRAGWQNAEIASG